MLPQTITDLKDQVTRYIDKDLALSNKDLLSGAAEIDCLVPMVCY